MTCQAHWMVSSPVSSLLGGWYWTASHFITGKLQKLSEISWFAWVFWLALVGFVLCCLKASHHWRNASVLMVCLGKNQMRSTSPWFVPRLVTNIKHLHTFLAKISLLVYSQLTNLQLKEPELSMKILMQSWVKDSCACPLQNIRLLHPSMHIHAHDAKSRLHRRKSM